MSLIPIYDQENQPDLSFTQPPSLKFYGEKAEFKKTRKQKRGILTEISPNINFLSKAPMELLAVRKRRSTSCKSGLSPMPSSQNSEKLSSFNLNPSIESIQNSQRMSFLYSIRNASGFSSQKPLDDFNHQYSSFSSLIGEQKHLNSESVHQDPLRNVSKDLRRIRSLKLTPFSSQSQLNSDILNSFEGEIIKVGKDVFSSKDSNEKVRARIEKELGSFVCVGKLGEGCFSEVELAFDKQTKKFYAMKKYPKKGNPFNRAMAESEYLTLRKIMDYDDPDLLQVKIVCYTPGESLVVLMEYGRGTLKNLLTFMKGQKKHWSQRDLEILYQQLVNQVQKIAKIGILHCDIKPDNIIIRDGGNFILSDYGCARNFKDYQDLLYHEFKLDLAISTWDHSLIIRTVKYVIEFDDNNTQFHREEFNNSALVKETVSFYPEIKDQFKNPFGCLEKAFEKILKCIDYFNIEEIVKYLHAKLQNTPLDDYKNLQMLTYLFGEIFSKYGRPKLALPAFLSSKEAMKVIPGGIKNFRAGQLYKTLALILIDLSHFDLAFPYLKISIHYFALAKRLDEIRINHDWLGLLNLKQGNLTNAESFYKELEDPKHNLYLEDRTTNSHSEPYLASLRLLVAACWMLRGNFERAIELTVTAISKYHKEFGLIHQLTGQCLSELGLLYKLKKNFETALKCFRLSMKIFIRTNFDSHYWNANTLIYMASIYENQGRKYDALSYYTRSLNIYRKSDFGEPYVYWLKYKIACVLIDLKMYQKTAQRYLGEVFIKYLSEKSHCQHLIANTWAKLEFLCGTTNRDFILAKKIYHKRLQLVAEDPKKSPLLPLIKLQIARNHIVYKNKAEYEAIRPILEVTYSQMKKRMFAYFPSQFESCLYSLGHVCYELQMYQQSHEYFSKCLDIRRLLYPSTPFFTRYELNEETSLRLLCQLEDNLLTKDREFSIEASKSILTNYDGYDQYYYSILQRLIHAKFSCPEKTKIF